MKIENIIRRVLREEQEEQILKIPGIRFFNNDWSILQKFLESQGYPRYSIGGDLDLREMDIESLGNLVRVEGDLDLNFCRNLQSLGNLERVEGYLDLESCQNLVSLGDLEYVGGRLDLAFCKNLQSLGDLKYVGGYLDLNRSNIESLGNLEYVDGWLDLGRTPSSKKYTEEEIREMIAFVGNVYL
jgi:hypothetical protein